MKVNFNDGNTIITYDGLQIVIQKEKAMDLAHKILDYLEWYEEED